jgi:hypothetical protein
MENVINQHLENVNDKQLVDALVKRGLVTEEEMKFRLISDEELLNKALHGKFEITNGNIYIRVDLSLMDELKRRTYIHEEKMEIYLSPELPF